MFLSPEVLRGVQRGERYDGESYDSILKTQSSKMQQTKG